MQINSTSSFTPQSSASLSVDNQNQVAEQRDRFRVQQIEQNTEQAEKTNKDSTQQAQDQQASQVARFDIDEQALALVEQAQFENQQAQLNPSASQTVSASNISFSGQTNQQVGNKNNSQASYDSPSKQNQTAIAAYSSVDNIAQRENIQQVFGIDLLV
ncbi:hypothetical protein A3Q34_15845 [Colwellia sp. PAMC 20917]|uniref:hypothetical protein n=1 Tax=Colwellia sp. PAMC 20917 TaxID=1816218 RepID=UPI000878CEF0|nr:hypothetical protein [Colwellia sp. PAMC 20917]AOW78186.1 hypothetical protein A3Q34_15845 [Colwellia sp. PAMC 20917]